MKYNKDKEVTMSKNINWWCNVIKKLRNEQGITLMELSLRTDITQSYLSRIENGKHTVSIAKLDKILKALGYQLEIVPIEKDVMF
tara:strand:- start:192 stop:446 length:255 start_codon:yes stop_codon:yes gene_type:complete